MREQPILILLADEFDEVYSQAVRLIHPFHHLLDQQDLSTFQREARSHQRNMESVATAFSIARSLIETGMPASRNDKAYRRIVEAVRK